MKKDILAKHREAYEDEAREDAKLAKAKRQPEDSGPKVGVSAAVREAAAAAALEKEKRDAAQKIFEKEKADLEGINEGVFAAWYNQPIFAALLSAAAVFGSLSVAGPLARLFLS